jgi:hypothetical protein
MRRGGIRGLRLLACALPLALATPATAAANAEDTAAIEAMFRAWNTALVAQDAGTMDAIASEDFTEIQDGDPVNRAMAIGMPTHSPDYRVLKVDIESFDVDVAGDSAQAKAVVSKQESFSGKVYTARETIDTSWARSDGNWQLTQLTEAVIK